MHTATYRLETTRRSVDYSTLGQLGNNSGIGAPAHGWHMGPRGGDYGADSGIFPKTRLAQLLRRLEDALASISEPTIWALAEHVLGRGCVRELPKLGDRRAALSYAGDRWVIYVRPGLRGDVLEDALAIELAEWAIRTYGGCCTDPEQAARHIAERLMLYVTPAA